MVQQILARSLATMVIIRFSPCVNVSCPQFRVLLPKKPVCRCMASSGMTYAHQQPSRGKPACSPRIRPKLLFWNLSGKVSRSILTTQITRRLPGSVLRDNVATLICCLFSVK